MLIYIFMAYSLAEGLLVQFGLIAGAGNSQSSLYSTPELLLLYALQLPFLVLAPLKHRLMPKVTIVCEFLGILPVFPMTFGNPSGAMLAALLVSIVFVFLFSWYLLRSKRVNVTYSHRVPVSQSGHTNLPNPTTSYRASLWMRLFWLFAGLIAIGALFALVQDFGK
ncbi:MAG: hypothetical protein KUG58_08505 [Marinosulfonomonas sp.]|nr:hypothetical protein [Marinosulfonomonas sp.]